MKDSDASKNEDQKRKTLVILNATMIIFVISPFIVLWFLNE